MFEFKKSEYDYLSLLSALEIVQEQGKNFIVKIDDIRLELSKTLFKESNYSWEEIISKVKTLVKNSEKKTESLSNEERTELLSTIDKILADNQELLVKVRELEAEKSIIPGIGKVRPCNNCGVIISGTKSYCGYCSSKAFGL